MNKEQALQKAEIEMKNTYYRINKEKNISCDWLEFELSCEDVVDNGREAFLIKVIGGDCSTTEYNDPSKPKKVKTNSKILERLLNAEYIHFDGSFSEDDNIKCLIYKDNGEYKYLGEE